MNGRGCPAGTTRVSPRRLEEAQAAGLSRQNIPGLLIPLPQHEEETMNRICPKCGAEYQTLRYCNARLSDGSTCGMMLQSPQEIRRDNAVVERLLRRHAVEAGERA